MVLKDHFQQLTGCKNKETGTKTLTQKARTDPDGLTRDKKEMGTFNLRISHEF